MQAIYDGGGVEKVCTNVAAGIRSCQERPRRADARALPAAIEEEMRDRGCTKVLLVADEFSSDEEEMEWWFKQPGLRGGTLLRYAHAGSECFPRCSARGLVASGSEGKKARASAIAVSQILSARASIFLTTQESFTSSSIMEERMFLGQTKASTFNFLRIDYDYDGADEEVLGEGQGGEKEENEL